MPIEIDDLLGEYYEFTQRWLEIRQARNILARRITEIHQFTENETIESIKYRSIYDELTDSLLVERKTPKDESTEAKKV